MCGDILKFVLVLLTCALLPINGEINIGETGKVYSFKITSDENVEFNYTIHKQLWDSPNYQPYRVEVSAIDANRSHPVFVVVRQAKSILSWQLPLLVEAPNPDVIDPFVEYRNTSRILCEAMYEYAPGHSHTSITLQKANRKNPNFSILLSTYSEKPVSVMVRALPVPFYDVTPNRNYDAVFSPSEPVYFVYEFPAKDVETVHLKVTSMDDVCFTVSIQPHICPIYDLQDHITYQGKYQTVSKNGGLNIQRKEFEQSSFVIVFVAHADNYLCDKHAGVPHTEETKFVENKQISRVQFTIIERKESSSFKAIISLLGFNTIFCVCILLLTCCFYQCGGYYYKDHDQSDFRRDCALTPDIVDAMQNSEEPKLSTFNGQGKRNQRIAMNYLWHIANIAIFYSLPVVQLMVFYDRMVSSTGNLDLCYYNSLCSHPLYFKDFNHIFSNLGYVCFGLLFLIITAFRHRMPSRPKCGIPRLYGLYYAMGLALVLEGVLSGCYHICPNQSNFQFDTSFMYVMAVLIIAKLYQNRHPAVQASAYSTFTVLGLAVMIAMLGIIYNSLIVMIVFYVAFVIFCLYLAFKIYFFTNVTGRIITVCGNVCDDGVSHCVPNRPCQLFFVFAGLSVNSAMALSGFVLYPNIVDFGTYLLIILMGNAIMYCIFYIIMKLLTGERICCEAMFYGLLAVLFWISGSYFFFNAATHWSKTPAQSRLSNQDCILFDFYDTHDIWHILSAPALFFTFSMLSALDFDLVNTKQNDINVF